jgi:hypothetical protein
VVCPSLTPHICHANKESQIKLHGNPESGKPQHVLNGADQYTGFEPQEFDLRSTFFQQQNKIHNTNYTPKNAAAERVTLKCDSY